MSIRPHDGGKPPTPPALMEWPEAPSRFNAAESAWWVRLGECALALGTISRSDLGLVGRLCQVSAKVDATVYDPDVKLSQLTALLNLELGYWKQLGLSPQSRRAVAPLPVKSEDSGFEDIEGGTIVELVHNA